MSALSGIKEVLSKPYYVLVAISGMLLFYLLSVIISDFSDLRLIADGYSSLEALKALFFYFTGYPFTIGLSSAVFFFAIVVLFGSYVAMAIYKTNQVKVMAGKSSLFGGVGIFLGVLAPGCAACGLGAASLFGLSGFLIVLPFKGMEVSILALLLLGYANWSIARKINKNTCALKI